MGCQKLHVQLQKFEDKITSCIKRLVTFPLFSTRGKHQQPEAGGRDESISHTHHNLNRTVPGHHTKPGISSGADQRWVVGKLFGSQAKMSFIIWLVGRFTIGWI